MMDFFQDLGWQQNVKSSFEPRQTLVHPNGFNGFDGSSSFLASAHKSAELLSFETRQDLQFSPSIACNSESTLTDDDEFGDFESVPAVTAVAAEGEDSCSQHVPPPHAGQLMLQVHGISLPAALLSQIDSVDPLASIHTRSRPLESKFAFDLLDSAISPSTDNSRNASLLYPISDISGMQPDKSNNRVDDSLADFDDVEWGDFVQPIEIAVASVQIVEKMPPDPNSTDSSSRPSMNLLDDFSEPRTQNAEDRASTNLQGKANGNAGSAYLEDAVSLAVPSGWSMTATSKAVSESISNETVADASRSMMTSDSPKEAKLLNTSTLNGNSEAVGVSKISGPISLSVFGDDDPVDEDLLFEDEFIFKPQFTSHKRSVSSSAIPSEALDGYIASLYTQSNGNHQRHQSWSTRIINPADAEEQRVVTANSLHPLFPNGEVNGFCSTQINGGVEDETNLKRAIVSHILESASAEDQHTYIEAWMALARVCASEMANGRALWQQASSVGMCSVLLSHSKGRNYFVALGQIYAVNVILRLASHFYGSWLEVESDQGKALEAELQRCRMDWIDLQDAVSLASLEFEGPSSLRSLERVYGIGESSGIDTFDPGCQMFCQLSLLPLHESFGVPAVKWGEHHYFLPVANLWANRVAPHPPQLPHFYLKLNQS